MAWAVWHAALLPNTGKKFPSFDKFVGEGDGHAPSRPLTPDEVMARMNSLRVAWAKRVVRPPAGKARPVAKGPEARQPRTPR